MAQSPILLARQPIYDAELNVAAYELLHRAMDPHHSAVSDGDQASSRVLLDAFGTIGIAAITEGKPALINFTEQLITNPAPPIDPQHLIVEVLEDVPPTPAVIAGLKRLRELGFRIALDDFRHDVSLEPMIELADIIKLDVLAMDEVELRAEVRKLRNYPVRLLAEKIESWEVYNHCVDLGFSLFQGFFLSRPQLVHGRRATFNRLTLMSLMAKVADPEIDAGALAATVATDPLLGFGLIKLVNSPMYRRATPVDTLRDAITWLGTERVRGWCYLLMMANIEGKPRELTRIAMARARFCELLGGQGDRSTAARCFTVGILSTLDAFMDEPMETLLGGLELGEDIRAALLGQQGPLGPLLTAALGFETAQWDTIPWEALQAMGNDESDVEQAYLDSLQWVTETLGALNGG